MKEKVWKRKRCKVGKPKEANYNGPGERGWKPEVAAQKQQGKRKWMDSKDNTKIIGTSSLINTKY